MIRIEYILMENTGSLNDFLSKVLNASNSGELGEEVLDILKMWKAEEDHPVNTQTENKKDYEEIKETEDN